MNITIHSNYPIKNTITIDIGRIVKSILASMKINNMRFFYKRSAIFRNTLHDIVFGQTVCCILDNMSFMSSTFFENEHMLTDKTFLEIRKKTYFICKKLCSSYHFNKLTKPTNLAPFVTQSFQMKKR